jgi:predicted nucleic acid-binding protein
MSLVVDSSMAVAWFFPDETNETIDAVMSRLSMEGGAVPPHWPVEVANAFLMAVRRKRIDPAYRDDCLTQLARFDVASDDESNPLM